MTWRSCSGSLSPPASFGGSDTTPLAALSAVQGSASSHSPLNGPFPPSAKAQAWDDSHGHTWAQLVHYMAHKRLFASHRHTSRSPGTPCLEATPDLTYTTQAHQQGRFGTYAFIFEVIKQSRIWNIWALLRLHCSPTLSNPLRPSSPSARRPLWTNTTAYPNHPPALQHAVALAELVEVVYWV